MKTQSYLKPRLGSDLGVATREESRLRLRFRIPGYRLENNLSFDEGCTKGRLPQQTVNLLNHQLGSTPSHPTRLGCERLVLGFFGGFKLRLTPFDCKIYKMKSFPA